MPKQQLRLALAALAIASFSEFASAQVLPPDVKPTCSFGPTEFADWFQTGTVTARGAVKPANSAALSAVRIATTSNGRRGCFFG